MVNKEVSLSGVLRQAGESPHAHRDPNVDLEGRWATLEATQGQILSKSPTDAISGR